MQTLARYRERRAYMLAFLGGKCVGCGTTEGLDVHHRDQLEKRYFINRIWSAALPRLVEELVKCELRCGALCHRKTKSYGRRRPTQAAIYP